MRKQRSIMFALIGIMVFAMVAIPATPAAACYGDHSVRQEDATHWWCHDNQTGVDSKKWEKEKPTNPGGNGGGSSNPGQPNNNPQPGGNVTVSAISCPADMTGFKPIITPNVGGYSSNGTQYVVTFDGSYHCNYAAVETVGAKTVKRTAPSLCAKGAAIIAENGHDIYRYLVAEGKRINLTHKVGGTNRNGSLSPDCKEMVFANFATPNADPTLWIVDLNGENPRQMIDTKTKKPVVGIQPDWGTVIAFVNGFGALATIQPNGNGLKTFKAEGKLPDTSPDGVVICFTSDRGNVACMDRTGRNYVETNISGDNIEWKADGSAIRFRNGVMVYQLNFATGEVTPVGLITDTAFDPSGSSMAVVVVGESARFNGEVFTYGTSQLWLIDTKDASKRTPLTTLDGSRNAFPDWRSEPKALYNMKWYRRWLAKQLQAAK